MTTPQLKEHFLIVDKLPTVDEFNKAGYLCALPIKDDNKERWILLRNKNEMRVYEYLQSPNDYKVKERIFNADIEGYSYVQNQGCKPQYISLELPKKWIIEDSRIKRKLDVVITDIDQENKTLLHELYRKVRSNT